VPVVEEFPASPNTASRIEAPVVTAGATVTVDTEALSAALWSESPFGRSSGVGCAGRTRRAAADAAGLFAVATEPVAIGR
jgi:hypothetical protein